jgi:hypothetical protein
MSPALYFFTAGHIRISDSLLNQPFFLYAPDQSLHILLYQTINYQQMKRSFYLLLMLCMSFSSTKLVAQQNLDSLLVVRGFCIGAPKPSGLDEFIGFINELGSKKVNTLILRVGYNYQFESHPELQDSASLSKMDVKRIVAACKSQNIRIIPQMNMLGHQSSNNKLNTLLKLYPQFDETPWVKMPAVYKWPNEDGLYCKSYCPNHPEVHKILFDVIDELVDVYEANAFHAGMDEVFYIGESKCPRCGGKDKAELFAAEVNLIRNHLAAKNRELWIWGDRLLDGKTTGLGIWEASYNNTARSIDLISKDVVICDWHYNRAAKTDVYFATKGFRVVSCPWKNPMVAINQVEDMVRFREQTTKAMKERFYGVVQTVWGASNGISFYDGYYGKAVDTVAGDNTTWNTFNLMSEKIKTLETGGRSKKMEKYQKKVAQQLKDKAKT